MPTQTSDNKIFIDGGMIKSVKTDQVKRNITVSFELPLNGDNFTASGKAAFWSFNELPVMLTVEPKQQSFSLDDKPAAQPVVTVV